MSIGLNFSLENIMKLIIKTLFFNQKFLKIFKIDFNQVKLQPNLLAKPNTLMILFFKIT